MAAHAPFCHCGCGRKCYLADIKRGYSAALDLPCGTIYLARKVACASMFLATKRPDLKDEFRSNYEARGKFEGKGSGPWRRALNATTRASPDRSPLTLLAFVGEGAPIQHFARERESLPENASVAA